MTVEVALALVAGARVDHLALCDGDDRNTGLITLARPTVLRDSPACTDRIRLRDVLAGPFSPDRSRRPALVAASWGSMAGTRAPSPSPADPLVTIGRRCVVEQADKVITRLNRRGFTSGE